VLLPFIKKVQINKQMSDLASKFYVNCIETLRSQALADLKNHFVSELSLLDSQLNIRYIGVITSVRKSLLVIEYMTKSLCPTIDRAESVSDNTLIWDSLMERLLAWLVEKCEQKGNEKYTNLVIMENTFYMLQMLGKLQSS
jgi:hypothetical protein